MKTGVLLAQLGTPDAPTVTAVRRYLKEFLSDRRVVDTPRWLWWPILHGIILPTRPRRSAANYQRIWTEDGSPLLLHTRAQSMMLGGVLGEDYRVTFGMRIGRPGLAPALDQLSEGGCGRILVLPLFPQYSTATTLSVRDAVDAWVARNTEGPEVELLASFPDHPGYIAALAASVRAAGVTATAHAPLIISFHGLPQRFADRGDPYPQECGRTARALAAALDLTADAWQMTYQSRFGREAWLTPYTDETLTSLARRGISEASIITPSFTADCLETIDEIGREVREAFEAAGGETLTRVECLNADATFVDALADMVRGA